MLDTECPTFPYARKNSERWGAAPITTRPNIYSVRAGFKFFFGGKLY